MSTNIWGELQKLLKDKNVATTIIGLISILSIREIIRLVKKKMLNSELESKRISARGRRDLKCEKFVFDNRNKVSSEKQTKILNSNLSELQNLIKTKKVSCEEVLITYALRAGTIGKELSYIADVDFENALIQAKEADKQILEEKNLGLLHGVPFSVYEQISVKGMSTTCGYTSYENNINRMDSLIVSILRKQGAIPIVKSNVPQGFMALEASNYLWGKALNPWNKLKTTGGSNGGEAGLIATRGSAFGVGSDIFGSIRVPCSFCGVYGFKPTSTRNSKHGAIFFNGSSFTGFTTLSTSWGPITRNFDDLLLVSKCLIGNFNQDVYTNNLPFNEENYSRVIDNNNHPMKIGYFMETKNMPTAPDIKEVMEDLIHRLKQAGYHLVHFPIDEFDEFIQLGMQLLVNSNVVNYINKELNGEKLQDYYQSIFSLMNCSSLWLKMVKFYKSMTGSAREANAVNNFKIFNKSEYLDATKRYLELKYKFINTWKENELSAIISPIFPTTAIDHGTSQYYLPYNHLCYLYNFADLPAVAIPITLNTSTAYNDTFNDNLSSIAKDNMKTSLNMPISLQVGTLPNEDELALRLAKEIDYFYRFDDKYGNELIKQFPINRDVID